MQIQHDEQTQILADAKSIVAAAMRAGLARKPAGGMTGEQFQRFKCYLAKKKRREAEAERYRQTLEAQNAKRNMQRKLLG